MQFKILSKLKFLHLVISLVIMLGSANFISSLESKTSLREKLTSLLKSLSKSGSLLSQDNYAPREPKEEEHTLQITGSAMREVQPNVIKIGIKIETENANLRRSYENNTQTSNNVTKVFTQYVPKENITTTNYNVETVYEDKYFPENQTTINVFKGYRVRNEMEVSMPKEKFANLFLDQVVQAGPVYITSVNFDYTEGFVKSIKDSILDQATLDAMERANSIAPILNVTIDDVKFINLVEFIFPTPRSMGFVFARDYIAGGETGFVPPIFYSGADWVTMDVRVTFVIKKK